VLSVRSDTVSGVSTGSGVVETFKSFSRFVKWALFAMLLLGVGVFAFGVTADLYEASWLKSYAYIPNILAGFTGFLIGVPFALVVLSALAGQRADKLASDRVQELSRIAWNQFREALLDLCDEQRIVAMESCAARIQGIHDQTWHSLNHEGDQPDETFQKEIAALKVQASLWSDALADMLTSVGNFTDLRLRWLAILRDWNTLDQYVRLQRLERGLRWFDRPVDSVLHQYLAVDQHPMRSFFEMHEEESWPPDSNHRPKNTMHLAYRVVDTLQTFGYGQSTFDRVRTQSRDLYPTTRVNGYLQIVDQSAARMRQLCYYVQVIEDSGWPAAATG
jgi:hypothetical protein